MSKRTYRPYQRGTSRKVYEVMKDGGKYTIQELVSRSGCTSAQVFRVMNYFTTRFMGSNTIEKDVSGKKNTYRLVPNANNFLIKKFETAVEVSELPRVSLPGGVNWTVKEVLGNTVLIQNKANRREIKQIPVGELEKFVKTN